MDPNNMNASDEASKRRAMQGQWKTPPLPVFPSGTQQFAPESASAAFPQPPPTASGDITLPESTDDYAKALQEAYRRGAEAAAAMQQQQQQALPNAVSCPNFQQFPAPPPAAPMSAAEPLPQQLPQPQPPQPTLLVPNPLALEIMPPPSSTTAERSFSLPDMASYAARAQAEEEKRQKRLARNRASARARRLRKKNLVDSYEGEVGVLELGLQKLRAHEWGAGHSHEALLEALGMDRGQQALSLEERSKLIQDILEQQSQQVKFLREVQLEQQMLKEIVTSTDTDDAMLQELKEVLELTPQQIDSLQQATSGLDQEVEAMETLESCLNAMKSEGYLKNDSIQNMTQQFMGIFHSNQVSKFLLWADNNAEALEQLDYCHAVSTPANAPLFQFGMDDYGGGSHLTTGD